MGTYGGLRAEEVPDRAYCSGATAMTNHNDNLKAIYQQLCESYRAIDETRTKLLGLLPLATGVGIFALSGNDRVGAGSGLSAAVGLFGVVATLGLFSYELHGIKKCAGLIDAGKLIEGRLNVYGQFLRRPKEVAGFIDEPFAASIIYPASLAGWTFFALLDVRARWAAYLAAGAVLVAAVAGSLWLIRAMEYDLQERKCHDKEPWWLRAYRPADLHQPPPDDAYVTTSADPDQQGTGEGR
jgi:hypothetical protein